MNERGFTIVEVIVAMVVVSLVAVVAVTFAGGASRSSEFSKLGDRQRAVASGVMQELTSDQSWITDPAYGCVLKAAANQPCDISARFRGSSFGEVDGTVQHRIVATATGRDVLSDGIGRDDIDGMVPDVYVVSVTDVIATAAQTGAVPKPYTITSTIDRSSSSKLGTIALRTCRVEPQVDDRSSAAGKCMRSTTQSQNYHLPDGWVNSYARESEKFAMFWLALAAMDPNRPDQAAIGRASALNVVPVTGVTFTLRGPIGTGTAPVDVPVDVGSSRSSQIIQDLEPGEYNLLDINGPDNTHLWKAQSVPNTGRVTVRTGKRTDIILMFAPDPVPVTIDVRTLDLSRMTVAQEALAMAKPAALWWSADPGVVIPGTPYAGGTWLKGSPWNIQVKLQPLPTGRIPLQKSWYDIKRWQSYGVGRAGGAPYLFTIPEGLQPGVYSVEGIRRPGTASDVIQIHNGMPEHPYIWVDPDPAVPTTVQLGFRYCDAAARRAFIKETCGAANKWCDDPVINPCDRNWDGGDLSPGSAVGSGGA